MYWLSLNFGGIFVVFFLKKTLLALFGGVIDCYICFVIDKLNLFNNNIYLLLFNKFIIKFIK